MVKPDADTIALTVWRLGWWRKQVPGLLSGSHTVFLPPHPFSYINRTAVNPKDLFYRDSILSCWEGSANDVAQILFAKQDRYL